MHPSLASNLDSGGDGRAHHCLYGGGILSRQGQRITLPVDVALPKLDLVFVA